MASGRCKEQLAQYEIMIYQMAMLLHHHEQVAVQITKQVLCQLWKDQEFFQLEPYKQRSRLIWLVSNQSVQFA